MSFSLKNKTILITGSTDGLGKKLAQHLTKIEANIIIHGKDKDKIEQTVKELKKKSVGKISSILCDLTQPEKIQKAFSEIKNLDILINCAGVWLEGNTVDASPEKIQEIVSVNLTAPLLVTQQLLPTLLKAKFAQIVNISSIAGVEIPSGFYHTIYSASKFGLQAFTEAMAKEFENKNLRVMGYYPGGMETELFKKAGNTYKVHEPWMFDPQESVEAITFMLTRDPKINIKRMDLINHLNG